MHLKQLKLAGFKSFVDPTVVHFPSQLVAIVGPNGCGKSNIIDAVRWVLGESSAKNLRGETMVDVIFNGSSSRKSIGQASVELLFDNSLGRLTGPFASYGEIAVKRVVTRNGDSSYYLNGNKCRRKDITDIFLGTGAGARSYSIIGQGTISRLIEAKPCELRAFLEEAAGVSKYKERRRETVQRIEQTLEHLKRVADIRAELAKQLQRIERQASTAKRYLVLKEDEKKCRANILALKWQELTKEKELKELKLRELALDQEQKNSVLTSAIRQRLALQEHIQKETEQSQQVQKLFYQLATEIARLEETKLQLEREHNRQEHEKQQLQEDWHVANERLKLDLEEKGDFQTNEKDLEKELQQLRIKLNQQEQLYQNAQLLQIEWEETSQKEQSEFNTIKRQVEITQVQLQHLEQRHQHTLLRLEKCSVNEEEISLEKLQQVRIYLEEQQLKLLEAQKLNEQELNQSTEHLKQHQNLMQETQTQLHQLQDDFHHAKSQYVALMAAQKAADKQENSYWSQKPKLIDSLQVEPKWQTACEMVLGDNLHAYVLEQLDEVWPLWLSNNYEGANLITMRTSSKHQKTYLRLTDVVLGPIPLTTTPLESVYIAENLDEAITMLPQLLEHESVVTENGFWLGKGWVKRVQKQEEMGLLARQQKIAEYSLIVEEQNNKIDSIRLLRDQYQSQLQLKLSDKERIQLALNESNEAVRVNTFALKDNEQSIHRIEHMLETVAADRVELMTVLEELALEIFEKKEQIDKLKIKFDASEQLQNQYLSEKHVRLLTIKTQNKQLDELRQLLHQTELNHNRKAARVLQLNESINREQARLDELQERLEQLTILSLQASEPRAKLQQQLAELLIQHQETEKKLTAFQEQSNQLLHEFNSIEQSITLNELAVKKIQDLQNQTRMQEQEFSLKAISIQESLEDFDLKPQNVLKQMPVGTTQNICEDELIALTEKIKNLGAINLAAMDEFATEQQRKNYLDEQHEDLSQALTALETAIQKMDHETQARLFSTFDEVNASFKTLFPRLFGGGRAQLELTCDNLLEAGIVVMAQPPGKRNSSIHLLSGGEKALTAVALVFALFQLNPSPFCMLDEVDAPLDDINVGRFCSLVKEMSQFVQFLFITHNKVTMGLADQLVGVTMREPGVSRLVAVEVEQALEEVRNGELELNS